MEHAIIAPVRQPDGQVTHYLAIKEDVTAKKRMSDELDAYRSSLEQQVVQRTTELAAVIQEQNALFDSASAGIVLIKDRHIVRCNRSMDDMLGYAYGEQIGQGARIWYPDEETYALMGSEGYAVIRRGDTDRRELEMARKDGSHFWVRMSSRAIDITQPSKGVVAIIGHHHGACRRAGHPQGPGTG